MTMSGLRATPMSAAEFALKVPKLSGFARRWMAGEFA
jgi:hypothetical protein